MVGKRGFSHGVGKVFEKNSFGVKGAHNFLIFLSRAFNAVGGYSLSSSHWICQHCMGDTSQSPPQKGCLVEDFPLVSFPTRRIACGRITFRPPPPQSFTLWGRIKEGAKEQVWRREAGGLLIPSPQSPPTKWEGGLEETPTKWEGRSLRKTRTEREGRSGKTSTKWEERFRETSTNGRGVWRDPHEVRGGL